MCRGNDHGGRRCPSDTSEARRLRRKIATVSSSHNPTKPVTSASTASGEGLPKLETLAQIQKEAKELNALLNVPPLEDEDEQDKIDALLETRVTNLGRAMGERAEKKIGFDADKIERQTGYIAPEFTKVSNELTELQAEAYRLGEIEENWPTYEKWCEEKYGEYRKSDASDPNGEYAQYDKEWEDAQNAYADAYELREAKQKRWEELDTIDRQRRADLMAKTKTDIIQAYKESISEVRPVGGPVTFDEESSDANAVKKYGQTVGVDYPTDWIKTSADHNTLRVETKMRTRASYRANSVLSETGGEVQPKVVNVILDEKNKDAMLALLSQSPGSINKSEGRKFYNNDVLSRVYDMEEREPFNPKNKEHGKKNRDGSPKDKTGWHFGHVMNTSSLGVDPEKKWYRIPTNTHQMGSAIVLDIGDPDRVYYHEFCHRVEDTVGNGAIKRQQEAFLRRRTTAEDNSRENLDHIYPPKSNDLADQEVGRRDKFLDHYMGKEYLTNGHREVLSMGSEALFTGEYGAFLGLQERYIMKTRADKDYRSFILGIFGAA